MRRVTRWINVWIEIRKFIGDINGLSFDNYRYQFTPGINVQNCAWDMFILIVMPSWDCCHHASVRYHPFDFDFAQQMARLEIKNILSSPHTMLVLLIFNYKCEPLFFQSYQRRWMYAGSRLQLTVRPRRTLRHLLFNVRPPEPAVLPAPDQQNLPGFAIVLLFTYLLTA